MKTLSLTEFKNFCNERSLHNFILTSDNQERDITCHTAQVQFSFPIMLIAFNPNMIYFKNNDNCLQLNGVKAVRIVRDNSIIGTFFDVVCRGLLSKEEIIYTFLAK